MRIQCEPSRRIPWKGSFWERQGWLYGMRCLCSIGLHQRPLTGHWGTLWISLIFPLYYTPCNTAPELQSPLPPDPSSFQNPYCVSLLSSKPQFHFWNSVCPTLPNPPRSMPIPSYPDRGFSNPISDLLIPLLRSRPCIVPHSYKSESPMYWRPSSNID